VDSEADILIHLARLRLALGNPNEAEQLAEEALLITERSGYVLQGADAHIVLALIAKERGENALLQEHAQRAKELATCDGPPDYTYKAAYEEASRLLDA
jgi:Tfp pilus assembly protein PilF